MKADPGTALDADAIREETQQAVAAETNRGYADCEESLEDIAGASGVSRALIRQWCAPIGPARISVADAILAPQQVRERLARMLARAAGFELVPIGSAASKGSCDLLMVAEAQGAAGHAIAVALRAMADRLVDRAEAREVRPVIRQARELLAALDKLFEQAERDGVAPVRMGDRSAS
ncbi:hypothetical protein [Sandaracinus amylolyticus]|uniref:hypothetical protein n=1 Tax=Sandaracinus amylolyticus TaxID=927083 RepID=UPI001F33BD1B|nr:hypothetical protein [Sandaracinus amylolyticus]UJR81456.1 Hypothetical protein I5071_35150 [Sandaracinus amylolyticus]